MCVSSGGSALFLSLQMFSIYRGLLFNQIIFLEFRCSVASVRRSDVYNIASVHILKGYNGIKFHACAALLGICAEFSAFPPYFNMCLISDEYSISHNNQYFILED